MEIYSRRNGFQDEIVMEPEHISDEIRDELELMNHSDLNIIKLCIQGIILTGNISGMETFNHSMDRLYSDTRALRAILFEVSYILTEIPEFLLLQDSISLDPEHIFLRRKDGHNSVCLLYIPGQKGNIKEQMTALMEYLLQHIDHKNDSAVRLIYGLYHVVRQENYALEDVMQFLREDASVSDVSTGTGRTAGGTGDTNGAVRRESSLSMENAVSLESPEDAQSVENAGLDRAGIMGGALKQGRTRNREGSSGSDDYTKEAHQRLKFYRLKSREICYATALAVMLIIAASVYTGLLKISPSGRLVILAGTFIVFAITAANTVKLIIFRNGTSAVTGDFPPG